ncbi:hypothetical protein ITJ66_02420 [Plantibacter sp. VKM Ac-2885]|uniref:hypothetical protein n=1 Tax=Plantibacter sp. VKM Ac-2885 TaxID=2783828 RepID=UPI00188AFFB8|nr:hypothetical protein [Plantibacter sp. VKM Ac-2885]MBF4511328.1 hypothetical protein [Plantibacter sp. VKM Ac-2885]
MTPSPLPVAVPVGGVPEWVPIAALIVSVFALLFTGVTSVVAYRNRADAKTVVMSLVRSKRKVSTTHMQNTYSGHVVEWTLYNGGNATVMLPVVIVTGGAKKIGAEFLGQGPLVGGGSLVVQYAGTDKLLDERDWSGCTAIVSWTDRGRRRYQRVQLFDRVSDERSR